MVPGELWLASDPVVLFEDAEVIRLVVENSGDRAVQVGSHYHFAQANPALRFDRFRAVGRRLAIPAGTSVRFEPGIEREVALVPLRGRRTVLGLRRDLPGLRDGEPLDVADDPGQVREGQRD
ncbi:urease subunit beta [Aciditerrimonas ferrireducens]|uniref:Urease subunit beta n=1 Tax=Aciditerrimonas ferrireducens TaxID=667306 RepID=A0ABV6C0P7_9ACTN